MFAALDAPCVPAGKTRCCLKVSRRLQVRHTGTNKQAQPTKNGKLLSKREAVLNVKRIWTRFRQPSLTLNADFVVCPTGARLHAHSRQATNHREKKYLTTNQESCCVAMLYCLHTEARQTLNGDRTRGLSAPQIICTESGVKQEHERAAQSVNVCGTAVGSRVGAMS